MSRASARRAVTALTWGLVTTLAVARRAELAVESSSAWLACSRSAVCGAAVREARCQTFLRRAEAAWS